MTSLGARDTRGASFEKVEKTRAFRSELGASVIPSGRRAFVSAKALFFALIVLVLATVNVSLRVAFAQTPGTSTPPPPASKGQLVDEDEGPLFRLPPTDAEKAEGSPIISIDVVGNKRIGREDVLSYIKLKKGDPFKQSQLSADVRALWDYNFFEDVAVDLTKVDAGVRLRLIVKERPNIREIAFEGNDELDNDKLTELVDAKVNSILSIPALRRSVQKMREAYSEKGYFLAEIDYALEPEKDNEVIVRFKVKEHASVTVRRVNFVGNEHVPESDLREVMQSGQGGLFSFGSGGTFRQDVFERDVLILSSLYYDRGYLNVQIGTPRVMLTPDREGVELTVLINEGPRYKVRQLKIFEEDENGKEVDPIGGRRALRQLVRAHSGDFFSRGEVVADLQAVRTLYRDAGYYFAETDIIPNLNPATAEVDLVVPIHRGVLTKVERIEVKGNTKTRDRVFRREMEIFEGDYFSETKLETSKRRITALGYFERVDVSTEVGSTPDKVVIYFEVGERPTGTFNVGLGFSSFEQLIATAQVQQANLFGNGQSLALNLQYSGLRQIFSIRFFEPYFYDSEWSFNMELYKQLYVFPDFQRDTYGGSLTWGYALAQPWLRLSLSGTIENNSVSTQTNTNFFGTPNQSINFFQRLPLANLFNDGWTISIRPSIVLDTRDNRLFPTNGVYMQFFTELASQYLGSQIEFLRHEFIGRFYYLLGGSIPGKPGSGFVMKVNSNVGYIQSPSDAGVPIYLRYFLGGILDVRGYNLRTISPRLPLNQSLDVNAQPFANGANIGGNLRAYANLEFEFPIVDAVGIRGVVF
ncbi:MAG: outer membrane protein assembly factor BamA, partial [Polyangiaceae bacterium]|nr:outer membrane protein assembly factor BamA [Polyangiaceae bacterium]